MENNNNNNNTEEESPDFHFPPPPTPPTQQQFFPNFTSSSPETSSYRQNPRKKRTKMIKINNNSSIMASSSSGVLKPKYGKKPDPGAPKITRPCSECGKKFWSWKALFGHMRCHPERQWRGINPPPNFIRRPLSPAVRPSSSSRPVEVVMTEEDHEIATCLLMLANGNTAALFQSPQCGGVGTSSSDRNVETFFRDVEMGGCGGGILLEGDQEGPSSSGTTTGNCRFECSSCKKVFGSHQALGGHRASHKNVKGCFAITRNDGEDEDRNGSHGEYRDGGEGEVRENLDEKLLMVLGQHRCSICLRVFSSGQALGGHKRCHWEKGEEPSSSSLAQGGFDDFATPREVCGLDLNLPAPLEDNSNYSYSSSLTLDLKLGI